MWGAMDNGPALGCPSSNGETHTAKTPNTQEASEEVRHKGRRLKNCELLILEKQS